MSDQKRITLYASHVSPFPHRVSLALEEAHVPYDAIYIKLHDEKPEWYGKKVYPEAKVPYLIYGGPKLNPNEAPAPDTLRLPESLVICEFLADIFPAAKLLPTDPAIRAQARLFAQAVETKFYPAFAGFFFRAGTLESLLDAFENMQRMLPPAGYAVGDWSLADAAFMPFIVRANMLLKIDPPTLKEGVASQVLEALRSPRFARLQKYAADNIARPSMAKTWDEAAMLEVLKASLAELLKSGRLTTQR